VRVHCHVVAFRAESLPIGFFVCWLIDRVVLSVRLAKPINLYWRDGGGDAKLGNSVMRFITGINLLVHHALSGRARSAIPSNFSWRERERERERESL
jgi:hypothetical protein